MFDNEKAGLFSFLLLNARLLQLCRQKVLSLKRQKRDGGGQIRHTGLKSPKLFTPM
ncbi:hypothetical protein GCWU000325_02687 [Alloprevotella tannerae ATCC 51259]|uniref:Uncharacterized protein n=1 Tax=Alloprevotella tannerae ATCC 51259 TaxID=626522 RepID=C9LKC2_9BACT|nr:hypothetical protein GCWU000325_02687 [Alloprevotella tannerae ATCC 51259]